MINTKRQRAKRRFQFALENMPQRGEGLHVAILGAANLGVAAGLQEDELVEAISALDRDFKPNEVEEAVDKAFADADGSSMRQKKRKLSVPVKKATKAGKLLIEDAERSARLQAALIESGGGEVDPFGPELRESSNPPPRPHPGCPRDGRVGVLRRYAQLPERGIQS